MRLVYDEEVNGEVYIEDEFPLIRYFVDGGIYTIGGHRCLVIGGAYSVDKYHRLEYARLAGHSTSGWFESEQLTPEEREDISSNISGQKFDFVLTHTCPIHWEPSDLFLNFIDQSMVEKDMEVWLDEVRRSINWKIWCFGHFHQDRLERPRVQQFYRRYESLDSIWNRWYDQRTIDNGTYYAVSPRYHFD